MPSTEIKYKDCNVKWQRELLEQCSIFKKRNTRKAENLYKEKIEISKQIDNLLSRRLEINKELEKSCNHPINFRYLKFSSLTDTLGNYYQHITTIHCEICGNRLYYRSRE